MEPSLRWPIWNFASAKYFACAITGAGFAFAVLTRDWFFAYTGIVFLIIAVSTAFIQAALLARRPWARRVAIAYSCVQLPSIALPVAALSLRDLLKGETKAAFQRESSQALSFLVYRRHRGAILLIMSIFALIVWTHLTMAHVRKSQSKTVTATQANAERSR